MSRLALLALVIAGLAVAGEVAVAQPAPQDGEDGRFTFHRADDGYLRLDGRTGRVSLCHRRSSGWQCQLVPDERSALETEIARLQANNAELKKELLSRNLPLPKGMHQEPAAPRSNVQRPQLPDDEELNRIMGVVEKVWRRMVEMILSVQRDLQKRM